MLQETFFWLLCVSLCPANVTAPQRNVTAPQRNVTAPQHNVTAPQHNVTAPKCNVTAPQHNVTAPQHNTQHSRYFLLAQIHDGQCLHYKIRMVCKFNFAV